ncbi:hypothetical protein JR316_0007741 [Psilocybe cubensis]|uniref:Uncharacterized protein n=2 Tax=Psilocybe cubensis TaxID=181762 RepID=A0ACB8GVA7_PSICU|nr:hypothetical protein JR316_0007741 [Psilocybe cubensis]KAH9479156.1 hypothetical protein JR316_0007741 [Psilocybe cubensis]
MSRATNTNAFTSYSPFFSSGLLAQSTNPRLQRRGTFNSDISEPWDDELSDSYRSSSPGPADSLMDTDPDADANTAADAANTSLSRRSATPTPRSNGESLSISPNAPHSLASPLPTPTQQQPRLRRRRSSLTQAATSPMNAIRGPARAAENALHLQKQLPVPSRARSGSVGADTTMSLYTGLDGTTTIVVGRMRSGSCSSVLSLPTPVSAAHLVPSSSSSASRYTNVSITRSRATGLTTISLHRPRRAVRRGAPIPVPALLAPPPTAPLPALPPTPAGHGPAKLRPANVNPSAGNTMKSPAARTSARARGLSVSSSALGGAENRIDEEMKEN